MRRPRIPRTGKEMIQGGCSRLGKAYHNGEWLFQDGRFRVSILQGDVAVAVVGGGGDLVAPKEEGPRHTKTPPTEPQQDERQHQDLPSRKTTSHRGVFSMIQSSHQSALLSWQ
jgi:hypothetical protein